MGRGKEGASGLATGVCVRGGGGAVVGWGWGGGGRRAE